MIHSFLRDYSNNVKDKLMRGEASFWMFLVSWSPIIAEACSSLPLDWIIIDMEASYIWKPETLAILQALRGSGVSWFIRIPEKNKHMIEFWLDVGSEWILVPKVDTLIEARQVGSWSKYPPSWERGVNPVRVSNYFENLPNYFQVANDSHLVMLQIESSEAVENIDDIASVVGVDVLFIGCGDLAASFGQAWNVTWPLMDHARREVLRACAKYKKIPGIFAYSDELSSQYSKEGFKFIAIWNDIKFLKEGLRSSLEKQKPRKSQ